MSLGRVCELGKMVFILTGPEQCCCAKHLSIWPKPKFFWNMVVLWPQFIT